MDRPFPEALRSELSAQGISGRRLDDYYLPVGLFCRAQLDAGRRSPLVVGVSGPQGSGKSTLVEHLARAFNRLGVRSLSVSVDDFYLTREGQLEVAKAHPGNRYLEHRGYPGTHDVELGASVVSSLTLGQSTSVPVYDKSAHQGRGDRAPESLWKTVTGPLDVLFFEGWMLGFRPVQETSLEPDLIGPNRALAAYEEWYRPIDAFVLLEVEELENIVSFRVDAERRNRERGLPALSDADARDYIERFLPAYRTYLPGLRQKQPGEATIRFMLGSNRLPLESFTE